MAGLGLEVRLEIRGAAEIGAEGVVGDARAIAGADDIVILAGDDEGRTLEIWCIVSQIDGEDGDHLADGERLLGGLGEGGHSGVVGSQLEVVMYGAEDVARSDVADVKDGEGAGPLQACDPRRKPLERELAAEIGERVVASENGGVGDARFSRYQCV